MMGLGLIDKIDKRNIADELTKNRVKHCCGPASKGQVSSYSIKNHQSSIVLVFIHGAGHSYASWIAILSEMVNDEGLTIELPEMLLIDLPGHGNSSIMTSDDQWSKAYLIQALVRVINSHQESQDSIDKEYILVGHSLGGALAMHLLSEPTLKINLGGCIILDSVEGIALHNLRVMEKVGVLSY